MNYLVVDDEPAICDGTIRRLRKSIRPGDRIWAAYSGEEALEILAAESIAVLITDIQMDALSGLGVIERAGKAQPFPGLYRCNGSLKFSIMPGGPWSWACGTIC